MPMSPSQIGLNGQSVRPVIQEYMDKIDNLMNDPVYTKNNNTATGEALENGTLIYRFSFTGHLLNDVEKSTIENGWVSEGWTSAVCSNSYPNARDTTVKWSLVLTYEAP